MQTQKERTLYMREWTRKNCKRVNEERREKYLVSGDKVRARNKIWRDDNKEKKSQTDKEYRLNNKDKVREKQRIYYLSKREELIKKSTEYSKNRLKVDLNYRLKSILRTRIIVCLVKRKYKKSKTTEELIGASIEKVREHLESQFKEGMTWSNHGTYGWHIDHIVPLTTAKDEEEVLKLFHFTNLQPLWAKDNLIKGSSLVSPLSS